MNQEEVLEKLKKDVRSLLVSAKEGLTPEYLRRDYASMLGHPMPLRVLGYRNVMDMAQDMPDVVNITHMPDGSLLMKAVADETTRGIQELVDKQRKAKKVGRGRGGPSFHLRNLSQSRVVLPRRGRAPPAMPALLRAQLQQLLHEGPLRVSELENSFRRRFGHPLRINDYGFYSLGEMLDVARDLVTVEQGRMGSVITWKQPPASQPRQALALTPARPPALPPARPPALTPARAPALTPARAPALPPAQQASAARFTPRPVQVPPAPRSPQQGSRTPRAVASPQCTNNTRTAVPVSAGTAVPVNTRTAVPVGTHSAVSVSTCTTVSVGTHSAVPTGTHSAVPGGGVAPQPAVEGSRCVEAQQDRAEPEPKPQAQPSQQEGSFEKSIIQLEAELRQRILENGVAGTVSPELKNNLREVVRQRKGGLSVHELPAEYIKMFGEDLLVRDLGFFSVTELVGALSDIFHLRPVGSDADEGHDWIITVIEEDADTQTGVSVSGAGDVRSYYLSGGQSLWEAPEEEQEGDEERPENLPETTSVTSSRSQIQVEATSRYRHIEVHSDSGVPLDALRGQGLKPPSRRRPRELGAVLVEHVESPGYFYVRFSEAVEGGVMEDMMIKMRSTYTSPEMSERYRLTESYIRQGQVCCVAPRDLWFYRVVIHRLLSQSQVEVYYVDFGDIAEVATDQLKFLKSCYSELPAQAVPSSLAGITPTGGVWSNEATSCFKRMCCDRLLVAALQGYHDDVLQLYLCDTHSEDDVYTHTVLHAQGHAQLCATTTTAHCVQFNPVSLYLGKTLLDPEEPMLHSSPPPITSQQCESSSPAPTPDTQKEVKTDTGVFDDMPALEFIDFSKVNCHSQEGVKSNPFDALFTCEWDRQWNGEPEPPTSDPAPTIHSPAPTIHSPVHTSHNPAPISYYPVPTSQSPASTSDNPAPTLTPTSQSPAPTPVPTGQSPAPTPVPTGQSSATAPVLKGQSSVPTPVPTSQSPASTSHNVALMSHSSAPDSDGHAPYDTDTAPLNSSPTHSRLSPTPTAVVVAESVLLEDDSKKTAPPAGALANLEVALTRHTAQRESLQALPPPMVMVPMLMPAYNPNIRTLNLPGGLLGMPVSAFHAPILPGFFFLGSRDFQQTPPFYR